MRFSIDKNLLEKVLKQASKAISSRATHPVLGCFYIEAESTQNRLTVAGFDLALSIKIEISAEVCDFGKVAVPASPLLDLVSKLPEGPVAVERRDEAIALTSSSGSYQVRTMDCEEYPDLPTIQDRAHSIELDPKALAKGLASTLFSASPDEARQVLNGVRMRVRKRTVELAATDGHRLSVATVPTDLDAEVSEEGKEEDEELFAATVPLKAAKEIESLLIKEGNSASLDFSSEMLLLSIVGGDSRIRLASRTIHGTYPAYEQLIPASFERRVVLNRKMLISGVERAGVFAPGRSPMCVFALKDVEQKVFLSSEGQEIGNAREEIDASIAGGDARFGFNINYLMAILRSTSSEEVELSANGVLAQVIFKGVGDPSALFLMMPVQIGSGNNEETQS